MQIRRPFAIALAVAIASLPVLAGSHLTEPAGLGAVVGGNTVYLSWTQYTYPSDCSRALNVALYRSFNGGSFGFVEDFGENATPSYADSGLANGDYEYKLKASCRVGSPPGVLHESSFSTVASATVSSAPACTGNATVTASVTPSLIWPPNGKQVAVVVSGTVTEATNCTMPETLQYSLVDEYGEISTPSPVTVSIENGAFKFQVDVQAFRRGDDSDGRLYTIQISAGGGSAVAYVTVPHDQRKK